MLRIRFSLLQGRLVILSLLLMLLTGCATQTRALMAAVPADMPRRVALTGTPFIAQERYQCGPAALAMALRAAGFAADADALVAQVYIPARQGSLQVEMLAAGRRNGAFSITIAPRMDALLAELAAGRPVLVLQNLSLPIAPRWHYAVAIGYDLDRNEILLHSGTTERLAMPLSTFEHTWKRSAYWGMQTLPPGSLPVSASEADVLEALLAFEKSSHPGAARQTYAAAVQRWPRNLAFHLGLGNTAYAAGDRAAAAIALERATIAHPDSGAAFNNLAYVLMELQRLPEARAAAEKAVALGGQWRAAAQDTLQTIARAEQAGQR
ncbi:PA2778 family cysteine peptidase [Massilia sp. PAMC28688]|uniref:PA2778 family cysteine peptidase n=1 Tax=Massilia sp. PAMC28688 TaxID=2861283 RepID=UPI001C631086|nr:PA2778 family cysteine peptidase [Massilia sp. PAMC28688]QYF91658.1 PA2778 family cysteine peptidase [Massilia sp. PAMC28688]